MSMDAGLDRIRDHMRNLKLAGCKPLHFHITESSASSLIGPITCLIFNKLNISNQRE